MTAEYESSRGLQIFRDEIYRFSVSSALGDENLQRKTFPYETIRKGEDLYRDYLKEVVRVAGDASLAPSHWALTLTCHQEEDPLLLLKCPTSETLNTTTSQPASKAQAIMMLQLFLLQHTLMWPCSLVRVSIPKSKQDTLVNRNSFLRQIQQHQQQNGGVSSSSYRVGMIRRVDFMYDTNAMQIADAKVGNIPSNTLEDFVQRFLMPLFRITVDFGEQYDIFPIKYISNDSFSKEEFEVFATARGEAMRGPHGGMMTPSILHAYEAGTVKKRLLSCRLGYDIKFYNGLHHIYGLSSKLVSERSQTSSAQHGAMQKRVKGGNIISKLYELRASLNDTINHETERDDDDPLEMQSKEQLVDTIHQLSWILNNAMGPTMEEMERNKALADEIMARERRLQQDERHNFMSQLQDKQGQLERERDLSNKLRRENDELKESGKNTEDKFRKAVLQLKSVLPKMNELELLKQLKATAISALNMNPNSSTGEVKEALELAKFSS
eukprot:Tbor_TRINITY_DN625_c0_g1::TRINITY_DN625_c0_g1_i1::g.1560::m.1560